MHLVNLSVWPLAAGRWDSHRQLLRWRNAVQSSADDGCGCGGAGDAAVAAAVGGRQIVAAGRDIAGFAGGAADAEGWRSQLTKRPTVWLQIGSRPESAGQQLAARLWLLAALDWQSWVQIHVAGLKRPPGARPATLNWRPSPTACCYDDCRVLPLQRPPPPSLMSCHK